MSTKLLVVLVVAAFAASISLAPGSATGSDFCADGTADLCESTCGEDHEDVQITEVCTTYSNGQTSCECCCYYEY
jgi:hypothetical protein